MELKERVKKRLPDISRKSPPKVTVLVAGATLAAMLFVCMTDGINRIEKIERNGYGENARKESVMVQLEGEDTQEMEIEILPREYTEEELQSLFRQAMKALEQTIIGKNKSLDYVYHDLILPQKLSGFPFSIVWEFSRYDVIDMSGKLKQDVLKELDKNQEGVLITISAVLKYQDKEALYSTAIRAFAKEKPAGIKERILELVKRTDEETRTSPFLVLPAQFEGKNLKWGNSGGTSLPAVLLLGMTAGFCVILMDKQKKEKKRKERQELMLCDYPEIISQFTMLMGAGMTAKNVWKKVTEDYREKKKHSGEERPAYEEMLYTWQEMKSGIAEAESYERFARRCGLTVYMKFGALLSQNLKKGTKGLADIFRMEAVQAMEDRKSRAKRLGEEAGTKLLVPMFLMLAVVMAVIIIPAFWSIQI